jgi:F-box-like
VIRIDVLPDDVLLGIFDFYTKMSSPYRDKTGVEAWQSLVHVCRRWRNLVFQSPRRLNLQLYCTPETPAKDTLDVWPALPLIVQGFMDLCLVDNIIAALGQSNRVCRVDLRLASWELEKLLPAMQVPFPELTELELFLYGEPLPVIPDSFLGRSAPRLRIFTLNDISFPGLPNLLLSATNLVSLRLTDIPEYISPEAMGALLSVFSSLETLYLELQTPQSLPDRESRSLHPPKHSVLPAFHEFHFRGATEYLEELVTTPLNSTKCI